MLWPQIVGAPGCYGETQAVYPFPRYTARPVRKASRGPVVEDVRQEPDLPGHG